MNNQCNIVILAAGASSRLGSAKQLLLYKQQTFLQHSIDIALSSEAQGVLVVLGANAPAINIPADNKKPEVIVNNQWQEGIASSIRAGLNHLLTQTPVPQQILFMVCDQPFITTDLLNKLITLQQQTGCSIVASEYAGTIGIPAVFDASMFSALLELKGDSGAKKIIAQQKEKLVTVPFPQAAIDIDTEADYKALQIKLKQEE